MSGRQHDQVPEVDLPALNPDQRSGVTCINCGTRRGPMRSIVTPSNRESTMVFVHTDIHVCLRRIARYVAELHTCLTSIAEDAGQALGALNDLEDETVMRVD